MARSSNTDHRLDRVEVAQRKAARRSRPRPSRSAQRVEARRLGAEAYADRVVEAYGSDERQAYDR